MERTVMEQNLEPTSLKLRTFDQAKEIFRSGERDLLLRRKRSFAQATGSRLGETINREPYKTHKLSLRWALLAWARPLLTQMWGSSPGLQLQQRASSSHSSSLRRASLAWARWYLTQNVSSPAMLKLERELGLVPASLA